MTLTHRYFQSYWHVDNGEACTLQQQLQSKKNSSSEYQQFNSELVLKYNNMIIVHKENSAWSWILWIQLSLLINDMFIMLRLVTLTNDIT